MEASKESWQHFEYTGKFPYNGDTSKEIVKIKKVGSFDENRKDVQDKGYVRPVIGILLLAFALVVYLINPLDQAVKKVMVFGPDTLIFDMWKNPPSKISLNFYIFNYTNSKAFLRGDEKLSTQQIGPYSYRELTEYKNITFNENKTMSYIPIRSAVFDRELTVGDPLTDKVVVPNFAFLGLASYLSESSFFTNMAFNVFSRMVKSEPFLTMTVDQYLRGYDEPLLSYANKLVPGMVTFGKMGYLDRIENEGDNIVTVSLNDKTEELGNGQVYEPFTVDNINGETGLREFGYEMEDNETHRLCNKLQGMAIEGTLIPRRLQESDLILFYRKGFCRFLPIVYDRPDKTSVGVPVYWLKFPDNNFHHSNPENSCYCDQEEEVGCLPEGLTDIGPCLFDMPVAMSAPHFLYGDPKLVEAWDGLEPNTVDHGSFGQVDNNFGVIINAKLRVQINLVVRNTKYNNLVTPFNNMVIPAVWVEYHINELPDLQQVVLYIAIVIVPIVHLLIIAVAILVGLTLVLQSSVRYFDSVTLRRRTKRITKTYNMDGYTYKFN